MAPTLVSRKRKVLVEPAPVDDELAGVELDGVLSQSEDDSDFEENDIEGGLDDNSSEDDLDERDQGASSDDDSNDAYSEDASSDADDSFGVPPALDADNSEPNYRVVKDANGGERYEYAEVDPVYDSDDSDAQGPVNTIGNIPLSFYDSYPHIGYDINGKKIMRPATGEALDALLDSIEIPKGWTGLTDPETGKPLDLTQDQLELLKRLQMNEVPNEGYDPYPVCFFLTRACQLLLLTCLGHGPLLYKHRGEDAPQRCARAEAPICSLQARGEASGQACSSY
jgi:ribosome biogenesis protein ERB1